MAILAGYTVNDSVLSARFRDDFDRTIQDCVAENFMDISMNYVMKMVWM